MRPRSRNGTDLRWQAALGTVLLAAWLGSPLRAGADSLDREGSQWTPYLEWELKNPGYRGNPFDLDATVTFQHAESGERRTTGMFYDGGDTWKFRFTGTRPGRWTFTTNSGAKPLDGRSGTVRIRPSDAAYGFVTGVGNRWARQKGVRGKPEAFVPQLVMYADPNEIYQNAEQVESDVRTFLVEHGFTGFHVPVSCRWFDLDKTSHDQFDDDDPNPDPRTFEALELVITRAHAAGGFVHLWAWGDEDRRMTPLRWGINGRVDRRLQRYIAARLGPVPGWTMGYGFDLWEWVTEDELLEWRRHLHQHLGWPHVIGGRAHQHGRPLEEVITDRLDYVGYETHRPDYGMYARALELHRDRPVLMEDRFRIRDSIYPEKDYDEELTRRGLWHSAMAGGVGNIWGYLHGDSFSRWASRPYPTPHAIRTNAEFLRGRFAADLERDAAVTDGVCLRAPDYGRLLVYREDAASIRLDLSEMDGPQPAVAVDARKPYEEIDLGRLAPAEHTWTAPYESDWAIAVGEFGDRNETGAPPETPPTR